MKPLSREAKAVLRDYRSAESLGSDARARVIENLSERIAAQSLPLDGLDVAPPEPVSQGLFAKALSGTYGKIGLAVIGLSLPVGWLIYAASGSGSKPHTLAALPSNSHDSLSLVAGAVVPPKSLHAEPDPSIVPRASGDPSTESPSADALSARVGARRSAKRYPNDSEPLNPTLALEQPEDSKATRAPVLEEMPSDMIDEEVRLLSQAHAALRAGRPHDALAKLRHHEKTFPQSKLSDARRVARMIALCDSGRRDTARAEAQAFLASRPTSPLASRVRTLCISPGGRQK